MAIDYPIETAKHLNYEVKSADGNIIKRAQATTWLDDANDYQILESILQHLFVVFDETGKIKSVPMNMYTEQPQPMIFGKILSNDYIVGLDAELAEQLKEELLGYSSQDFKDYHYDAPVSITFKKGEEEGDFFHALANLASSKNKILESQGYQKMIRRDDDSLEFKTGLIFNKNAPEEAEIA